MSAIQWTSLIVTVALFVIAHAFTVFRWISSLTSSLTGITEKFEERTSALLFDMRVLRSSLEQVANTLARFERVEEGHRDHEARLRKIEQECVSRADHEERISQLEMDGE
jgi:cell shape-determining protein MreC